ncbi:MAG: hypothetical protein VW946_03785 [Gammaproteobacteria bacterium]
MNKFFALLALLVITYVAVGLIMPTDEELRAYNVVSECWQEEVKACKNSDNEKACTENVSRSCAVKHPEMYKIFDKKLARCSEKYPGTALDNPDIWKCTGAKFDE